MPYGETVTAEPLPLPIAGRRSQAALRIVQLGALAVVLAATTHRLFDLDRFLVPKDLVLHATAALAGLLLVRRLRPTRLLILFLLLSAVSAAFATNPWLAFRALAISASGVLLFWIARALREEGLAQPLLHALALGVVLACVTSLAQAYGIRLDLFSVNRAPGGTLGNRNFVAHAAAFGFPVVMYVAMRARTLVPALGVPIVIGTLVLTRSRAAWLAFAAVAIVFALSVRRDTWKRFALIVLLTGAGVAAALLIPNTLRWRSDNPYLESVKDVANYQEGSGRGRLIQYEQSLRMAASHPILGVGPGNWAVRYPEHATRRDPSMDDGGVTFNPWPSSDWVAYISERGLVATVVLGLFFVLLAWRRPFDFDGATVWALIAGALIAGAFDAVLLLPLPCFFVFTTLGALSTHIPTFGRTPAMTAFVALVVTVIAALGAVRSGMQIAGMELFSANRPAAAAQLDPGNYRAQLRLARGGKRAVRCEHALAAQALYPNADAAKAAARGCD